MGLVEKLLVKVGLSLPDTSDVEAIIVDDGNGPGRGIEFRSKITGELLPDYLQDTRVAVWGSNYSDPADASEYAQ